MKFSKDDFKLNVDVDNGNVDSYKKKKKQTHLKNIYYRTSVLRTLNYTVRLIHEMPITIEVY